VDLAAGDGVKPHKKDKNHHRVTNVLHRLGCTVTDLAEVGRGVPDVLVGVNGENVLVEIKNPLTQYGRRGLNKRQQGFAQRWRGGPVHIIRNEDDCIALVQGDRAALVAATEQDAKKPAGGDSLEEQK
jgi:hypothetical protein